MGVLVLDSSFWILRLGMALITFLLTHIALMGIEKIARYVVKTRRESNSSNPLLYPKELQSFRPNDSSSYSRSHPW
jgi:F0F1-type ATP synthase membrane subunit a